MPIAPAGLIGATDPFGLGYDLAAITHGNPTGYLAAGFLAQLLAEIASGASLQAARGERGGRPGARARPRGDTRGCEEGTALARTAKGTPEEVESLGGGWIAEEAVAMGLFAALVAKDLEHGVLLAVNHGGDSDSTGSIAGNILGLLYGKAGIPTRWLGQLELHGLIREVARDLWSHFGEGAQERPDRCPDFDKYPGC